MFQPTILQIAAISTVPCTAVGASAYIGYQQYVSASSGNENIQVTDSNISVDLASKKLQLINWEVLLKNQESLLKDEEATKVKLEVDLLILEIEANKKTKADIETKRDDFIKEWDVKEEHAKQLQTTTNERDVAQEDKDKKQALVTDKEGKIKVATTAHTNQQSVEASALTTKQESEAAFNTANTKHSTQIDVEATAEASFNAHTTTISSYKESIKTKEANKTELEGKHKDADDALTQGKTTCDTDIALISSGQTCDDVTGEQTDSTAIAALNAYKTLKEAATTAQAEVTKITGEIDVIQKQLTSAEALTVGLQTALNEAKSKTTEFKAAKEQAQTKKTQDADAYSQAQTKTECLKKEKEKLEGELTPLKNDLTAATTKLEGLESKLLNLQNLTNGINGKYETSKTNLEALIGTISTKDTALQVVAEKLQKLDSDISAQNTTLNGATTPEDITNKTLEEITKAIKQYKADLATSLKKIQSYKDKVNLLKGNVETISIEINKTTEEISQNV